MNEQQDQREREPIGEVFERVVADGRAAANAEIGVLRAIIAYRVAGLKIGMPLLIAALFLAQAMTTAMLVGLIFTLAPLVGPGWATMIVVLVAGVVIGLLAWAGIRRCASLTAPLPEETK